MDRLKILVATHKAYEFPSDGTYAPIHVGKAVSSNEFGVMGDDIGENISIKNPNFCEVTALYWAWKNRYFEGSEYCGLVHYRRYFKGGGNLINGRRIGARDELLKAIEGYDVLVPRPRKYYIETVAQHYGIAHSKEDLLATKEAVLKKYPEDIGSFNIVMQRRQMHLFNMFVMRSEDFDDYCRWLFDILFELETRIDVSEYNNYQRRVFGFIAERLFNVWLVKKNFRVKAIKTVNTEGEQYLRKLIIHFRSKIYGESGLF